MRSLHASTLAAALVVLAAGCVVDGDDPAGPCDPGFVRNGRLCVEASGRLDVAWSPEPDCPDGASTAQVVSADDTGVEYVDLFWCDDMGGVTGALPLGSYQVQVRLVDGDEIELFAQSAPQTVDLTREAETELVDFDFVADRGYVAASWSVADGCAATGIATIDLVEADEVLAAVACSDGSISSDALSLGPHDVYLRALADDGESVVATTAVQSMELEYGNQLVDLGRFEL